MSFFNHKFFLIINPLSEMDRETLHYDIESVTVILYIFLSLITS